VRGESHDLYGELPGGSGNGPPILAHLGGHGISNFPHASRVSWSEVLARPDTAPRKLEFMGVVCAER